MKKPNDLYYVIYNMLLERYKRIGTSKDNELFLRYLEEYLKAMPNRPKLSPEHGYESDVGLSYNYVLERDNTLGENVKGTRYVEYSVNNSLGTERTNSGIIFGFIAPNYQTSQRFDKEVVHGRWGESHSELEISSRTISGVEIEKNKKRILRTGTSMQVYNGKISEATISVSSYIYNKNDKYGQTNLLDIHSTISGEALLQMTLEVNRRSDLLCRANGNLGLKNIDLSSNLSIIEDMRHQGQLLKEYNDIEKGMEKKSTQYIDYDDERLKLLIQHLGSLIPDDMEVEIATKIYSKLIKRQ